jgi:hypothetical protein
VFLLVSNSIYHCQCKPGLKGGILLFFGRGTAQWLVALLFNSRSGCSLLTVVGLVQLCRRHTIQVVQRLLQVLSDGNGTAVLIRIRWLSRGLLQIAVLIQIQQSKQGGLIVS